jgi:hypothetical protein
LDFWGRAVIRETISWVPSDMTVPKRDQSA